MTKQPDFVQLAEGLAFVGGAGHGGSPGETADRATIARQGTMTFRDAAMSAAHAGRTLAVARRPVQNSPHRSGRRGYSWTQPISTHSRSWPRPRCRPPHGPFARPAPTTRSPRTRTSRPGARCGCARACSTTSAMSTCARACSARTVASPIMVAPTGRHKLFNPEGERATARGAATAQAAYVMASNSNVTIEEAAAERRAAPQWFQLYYWPNRERGRGADRPAGGGRLLRAGAHGRRAGAGLVAARGARAARAVARDPQHQHAGPADGAHRLSSRLRRQGDVSGDLARTGMAGRSAAPMPVMVKGVLRADDAARCAECGARAVIVSNHGGRHLDTHGDDRRRRSPKSRRRFPARPRSMSTAASAAAPISSRRWRSAPAPC